MIRAELSGHYRDDGQYPAAVVNITNRCNLSCQHCFIFRDGNPNEAPRSARDELSGDAILETLVGLRERHGVGAVLWMGGEPLLRRDLIREGLRLFPRNTIVTNGTIPLADFGPNALYVVSLDGPEELNDAIRGRGTYRKVVRNLSRIPAGFTTPVQVQCVVTKRNQHRLEEVVLAVRETRAAWITFSFYVPRAHDTSPDAWQTNDERAAAVREVMRLKARYPGFVRNSARMLELMLPPDCQRVTDACPARDHVLPLYLDGDHFTTPFCCYGNDVDCDRCGAWVVFSLAAKLGVDASGAAAAPA
ncbi:MAG: radical SAM protein [Deltaproteobacteria bacterium]|nr:radical SAM protein [Deltaproteobacteria bacterium]